VVDRVNAETPPEEGESLPYEEIPYGHELSPDEPRGRGGRRRRPRGRRRLIWATIVVTLLAVAGIGGYMLFDYSRPYLHGTDCSVAGSTPDTSLELDLEQAQNASTIAAVAYRKKLPEQALVIAYATAIQESKIRNLPGGDRDSIGLFQQRPSQGWGSATKIHDPVYATNRFFDALLKVKHYQKLPVEEAAQKVQHSADGSAYAMHIDNARLLAAAFTGRTTAAVHCWYSPDRQTAPRRTALTPLLQNAFGPQPLTTGSSATTVPVDGDAKYGWSVAAWAVAHAQQYGLREVSYAGKHWTADDAFSGWQPEKAAPADRVTFR
jgi:hypothetical protein